MLLLGCVCCSHHAFPYSARHGLEWWEIDLTWYLICGLKALGIVWDVQVWELHLIALCNAAAVVQHLISKHLLSVLRSGMP